MEHEQLINDINKELKNNAPIWETVKTIHTNLQTIEKEQRKIFDDIDETIGLETKNELIKFKTVPMDVYSYWGNAHKIGNLTMNKNGLGVISCNQIRSQKLTTDEIVTLFLDKNKLDMWINDRNVIGQSNLKQIIATIQSLHDELEKVNNIKRKYNTGFRNNTRISISKPCKLEMNNITPPSAYNYCELPPPEKDTVVFEFDLINIDSYDSILCANKSESKIFNAHETKDNLILFQQRTEILKILSAMKAETEDDLSKMNSYLDIIHKAFIPCMIKFELNEVIKNM